MEDRSRKGHAPPYPEPTIVLGIGRVGLSVLEQLGDDWATLQRLQPHRALRNLRLIHLSSAVCDGVPTDRDDAWRRHEEPVRALVTCMGVGERPTLALDFVVLRTLGLVRLVNGLYEVARPIDRGVRRARAFDSDRLVVDRGAIALDGVDVAEPQGRPFRIRTVEWLPLSADPILAIERLAELRRQYGALDRLVGRMLYRVRSGHSPQTLLATIGRVRALQLGRDPSPWPWAATAEHQGTNGDNPGDAVQLKSLAASKREAWGEAQLADAGVASQLRDSFPVPDICLPTHFDPIAPCKSMHQALLADDIFDFFAHAEGSSRRAVHVLPARDIWHGFYDLDSNGWRRHPADACLESETAHDRFEVRLRLAGQLALQGLVRLWDDLHKGQRRNLEIDGDAHTREQSLRRAVEQCIEILGDAVVRHQLRQGTTTIGELRADAAASCAFATEVTQLPAVPSSQLMTLRVVDPTSSSAGDGIKALQDRMHALGVETLAAAPSRATALFRVVDLSPNDVSADLSLGDSAVEPAEETIGADALRKVLAQIGRELFDYDYLRSWRRTPVRRSPRLTIYIVGELSEPLARATLPTVVRMVHSTLGRTLGPIFVQHRLGLDRAIQIVPVLCMPNPADACDGGALNESRIEEALVLESLHVIRRKLEAAPGAASCVRSIFLHGRVTDNAVHSVQRAVQNIRDFITLFSRNQLGPELNEEAEGNSDLSAILVGQSGGDLFATFTCVMAELPRAQLRWYAGNRLARAVVRDLEHGEGVETALTLGCRNRDPLLEQLSVRVADAASPVRNACKQAAERARAAARGGAGEIDDLAEGAEIAARFRHEQTAQESQAISEAWRALTAENASMSHAIDLMRADGTRICHDDARETRRHHDEWMETTIGSGRSLRAVEQAFEDTVHDNDLRVLEDAAACETRRRECASRGVPDPRTLDSTRSAVVEAASIKPALPPMQVALALWAMMATVLGAPLSHAVALALGLDQNPNGLEWVLGPMAPVVGVALLWPPVFLLLRQHMRRAVTRLQDAIDQHGDAAAALFVGSGQASGSALAFLNSRIELLRANAVYGHSTRQRTITVADRGGLRRIVGSVAALRNRLNAEAERLGVRELQAATVDSFAVDDTTQLLDRSGSRTRSWLLRGRDFGELYSSWFHRSRRDERDKIARILRFMRTVDDRRLLDGDARTAAVHPQWAQRIAATASLRRWRSEAWLADGHAVVEACSSEFDRRDMRGWPGAERQLEGELERFVLANYPNIGFAARFRGYEGLDENGLAVPADAALLVDSGLLPADRLKSYRDSGPTLDGSGRRPVVHVESFDLDVEAACLLSLARDIQLESLRNLRRFESHFETARPPDDRLFPYSPGGYRPGLVMPVTLTSSHAEYVSVTRQAFGTGSPHDVDAAAEGGEFDAADAIAVPDVEIRSAVAGSGPVTEISAAEDAAEVLSPAAPPLPRRKRPLKPSQPEPRAQSEEEGDA